MLSQLQLLIRQTVQHQLRVRCSETNDTTGTYVLLSAYVLRNISLNSPVPGNCGLTLP